jgi:phage repressor protein C with HTH and peptisase S24 domain
LLPGGKRANHKSAETSKSDGRAKMNCPYMAERLRSGKNVQCRPKGNSMKGRIESGQLITISHDTDKIEKDDIVFCKVHGQFYIHLVKAIRGEQYQIGNNRGRINGWVTKNSIFGKVVQIED